MSKKSPGFMTEIRVPARGNRPAGYRLCSVVNGVAKRAFATFDRQGDRLHSDFVEEHRDRMAQARGF
jgi:hypothetical protein